LICRAPAETDRGRDAVAENLRRAIDSRDVIGQAKGILMQRRGIGADEAFVLLRRTSQQLNVKLAELARTLATRHTELDLPRSGRD
jgi:AmiR/NasT family two-component response regulator